MCNALIAMAWHSWVPVENGAPSLLTALLPATDMKKGMHGTGSVLLQVHACRACAMQACGMCNASMRLERVGAMQCEQPEAAKPRRICQDSAEVCQSPREPLRQRMREFAKAPAKPPEPADVRQDTEPAHENPPSKRPSLEEAVLRSTS